MSFQSLILSALSCVSLAIIGILVIRLPKQDLGPVLLMFYYGAALLVALVIIFAGNKPFELNRGIVLTGCGMGIALIAAAIFQFFAIQKRHEDSVWIMLIGSLNPAIIFIYCVVKNPEMFTTKKCVGGLLMLAGLIFIGMPDNDRKPTNAAVLPASPASSTPATSLDK